MTHLRRKLSISLCILGAVTVLPEFALARSATTGIAEGGPEVAQPQRPAIGSSVAQSQTSAKQGDRPNRVAIAYVPPANQQFKGLYDFLKERRALEKIQELLSPFRLPGSDRQDGAMRRSEFVLQAREWSANSGPLLRVCAEHIGHPAERNHSHRAQAV